MKDLNKCSSQSGVFKISPDQEANGTLTLAGRSTSLYVWSEDPLDLSSTRTITGTLDDLTKVSLLGCNVRSEGHIGREDRIHYKCLVSPQCIILGNRHFSDEETDVHQISFTLEHAVALFHDTDAYGVIFNDSEAVERLAQIGNPGRAVRVEDWNWIAYYTGKKTVFISNTALGQVSADHSPIYDVGDASNSGLTKKTYINIEFESPLTVVESLLRMGRVLQFIDIVVGQSQSVPEIRIYTGFDNPYHTADVYSASYAEHHASQAENESNFYAILIHPVRNARTFSRVLGAWLERDAEWCTARLRLSRVWGERIYDYNRIIAAANVFDLLPSDVYGSNTPLPQEFSAALKKASNIIRELDLPESEERKDVLSFLGNVGGWRLKRKIKQRAKSVTDRIGHLVPEIEVVIDEAVNVRNYFVHGTCPRLRNDQILKSLSFLTNSLEFIFFASDLVEAGWDIVEWCGRAKPIGHPFHDYLVTYQENLSFLKKGLQ